MLNSENKKNYFKILFLLYSFYSFPFIFSILRGGSSTSLITTNIFSPRNISEIFMFFILCFFVFLNLKNLKKILQNPQLKPFIYISFVYLVSSSWSQYKLLTLFRSSEFIILSLTGLLVYSRIYEYFRALNVNNSCTYQIETYLFHLVNINLIHVFLHKFAFNEVVFGYNFLRDNLLSNLVGGCLILHLFNKSVLTNTKYIIFLLFVFLFVSFSLAPLVCFLLSFAFIFLANKDKNIENLFVYFVILISLLYFFFIEIPFIDQLLAKISFREIKDIANLTGREKIWDLTLYELKNYTFGSGFATDLVLLKPQFILGNIGTVSSSHNIFIESFVAAKWAGLFLVIYAYFLWFSKSKKYFKSKKEMNLIKALTFYAFMCGFANSGFGGSYVSHPYMLFWIFLIPIHFQNEKK